MFNEFLHIMKQEWVLTLILFILLFIKLAGGDKHPGRILNLVNVLLLINLASGFFWATEGNLFGSMFRTNALITFEKNLLNLGTLIISLLAYPWLKTHKHYIEFYLLLFATLLGMFFLLSSNHLLMFYLGLELSTIPLSALANFDLDKKRSSEAAFKMIISSAFSSGLLLFGISLAYGATGTLDFDLLAGSFTDAPLSLYAFVLILAGLAFKISAVPFHLWTADVYEGAPVAVTSYLSVISKGAVVFVMISVLYRLFSGIPYILYYALFVLSVLSMVIGNLFALRQQNLKRFLAFSSIAQIGFILIGLAGDFGAARVSVVYFILIYIFSNLGAFAVISLVSATTGKENIDDYKGFYKTNPGLSWVMAISLFSLAGIPPTAGFFGKFFLLISGAGTGNYIWITIAALNMVISLYYYLKVIRAIFMDANEYPIATVKTGWSPKLAIGLCLAGILVTGLYSGGYQYIFTLLK